MKRLDFVFHDAGGGHRNAATSLQMVIEQQRRPWEVRLVNLQEVLDPLDLLRRLTGLRIQECYNAILRNGWTLGSRYLLRVLQTTIRLYHRPSLRLLEAHWQRSQPDLVVSLVPHFNQALYESFAGAFPGRPFVTILTDLADYPPHFWMERQPQYFICGTARAKEQARTLGIPENHIGSVSGMILHPRFYQAQPVDRRSERRQLGLDADLPTGLVLFGGYGSRVMLKIAERLDRSGLNLQLISICGRNDRLAARLRAPRWRIPMFVEGFTSRVNYYMQLADFFLGKPGPGSISEALAMQLPVLVECNAWTLPQERYNADWVLEKQVGLVVPNFRRVAGAVAQLLEPGTLARYRANAAALRNRAVFEIPDMLGELLGESQPRAAPSSDGPPNGADGAGKAAASSGGV